MNAEEHIPDQHEELHKLPDLDFEAREEHLLKCPRCHHLVKAEDIDLEKLRACCAECQYVFSYQFVQERSLTGYSRPDMLIPEGLEVLKLEDELDIIARWKEASPKSSRRFTWIFSLIWNLILLPFVLAAIASGEYTILLFTSAHLLVGLFMILRLMAIYMNETHVNVSRKFLEISSGPIPAVFRPNQKIPAEEIDQLYVTKYVESRTNDQPNYAHALYVILKSGRKIRLIRGMSMETQRYLEYEIESFLGIQNRYIEGSER